MEVGPVVTRESFAGPTSRKGQEWEVGLKSKSNQIARNRAADEQISEKMKCQKTMITTTRQFWFIPSSVIGLA